MEIMVNLFNVWNILLQTKGFVSKRLRFLAKYPTVLQQSISEGCPTELQPLTERDFNGSLRESACSLAYIFAHCRRPCAVLHNSHLQRKKLALVSGAITHPVLHAKS